MTTSPLRSSRVSFVHFLFLLAVVLCGGAVPARAAQETFWPFNLFPPPASNLTYTNDATTSVAVPTVGTITSRHVEFSAFINSITLPGLGSSAVYNNASTRLDSETSLDG